MFGFFCIFPSNSQKINDLLYKPFGITMLEILVLLKRKKINFFVIGVIFRIYGYIKPISGKYISVISRKVYILSMTININKKLNYCKNPKT